jgi:hypothetical protein
LWAGWKEEGHRPNLQEITAIITPPDDSNGVDYLLNSPQVQDEYYDALKAYFGEHRFSRASFDAIFVQLKKATTEIPGFSARLWEQPKGETFTLKTNLKSSGRKVNNDIWQKHLSDYKEGLKNQASTFLVKNDKGDFVFSQDLENYLKEVNLNYNKFQEDLNKANTAKKKAAINRAFYSDTLSLEHPKVKQLSSAATYMFFNQEATQDRLGNKNADSIISFLKEIKKNPKPVLEILSQNHPEFGKIIPASLFKEHVYDIENEVQDKKWNDLNTQTRSKINTELDTQALSKRLAELPNESRERVDYEIQLKNLRAQRNQRLIEMAEKFNSTEAQAFPVSFSNANGIYIPPVVSDGEVEFKSIPKRIHGVFRGISLGECVGGNCTSLPSLTPERWATVAIKDSEMLFVERKSKSGVGTYDGFIEQIPYALEGSKGKLKTFGSVGFGSPHLTQKTTVIEQGKEVEKTLFELWYKKAEAVKPKEWKSLTVSANSLNINNAGVLGTVRKASVFDQSPFRISGTAQINDPIIEKISKIFPAEKIGGYAKTYGGKPIYDASQDSTHVRLVPEEKLATANNPRNIIRLYKFSTRNKESAIEYF